MRIFLSGCLVAALLLAGCGGGGGGDGSVSGGGGSDGFPVLVKSGAFQLPPVDEPPERGAVPGIERGRVLMAAETQAPVGTIVEVVDASGDAAPRVVATATIGADGHFSVAADLSGVAPSLRWLRVNVNGTVLRAFAAGWTELSPGTEAAVVEFTRLRGAGRLADIAQADLAASQELLTLVWLGSHGSLAPDKAVTALLNEVRTDATWNRWLSQLSSGSAAAPGDVAGLMPVSDVTWSATVIKSGSTSTSTTIRTSCTGGPAAESNGCSLSSSTDPDLFESMVVDSTSIRLREVADADILSMMFAQIGELPLIEFSPAVGTRILYSDPRFTLQSDNAFRASISITRRTFPMAAVSALGGSPLALRVVLDYEIAILNTRTNEQVDLLAREQRWFSPKAGRVRVLAEALVRTSAGVSTDSLALTANDVSGVQFMAPSTPFAGVADSQPIGLRHYHAVHSQPLDRVYVASPDTGGAIVELSATTMTPLRTLVVGTIPRRLAVTADGQRIFAGLDDGSVGEWNLVDLSPVSRTVPMVDDYGVAIDRVFDLAIDPFDSRRVLALVGASSGSGRTAVVLLRNGSLILRDAPRYNALGWGWGYYGPYAVAWTGVPDEFIAPGTRSQNELNRFSAIGTSFQELLTQDTGEDTGWIEVAGELTMSSGAVRDASSFAEVRKLSLSPLRLSDCARFDLMNTLCRLNDGSAPPQLLLLDHASGSFVGVYRPSVTSATNGCPERGVREGSLGLDDLKLTPIGHGRLLASSLTAGDGDQRCNLQVWTLRGLGT